MQSLKKETNLLFIIFLPFVVFSQSGNDCELSSINSWQKAYIKGGIFECSDWVTEINEEFEDDETLECLKFRGPR